MERGRHGVIFGERGVGKTSIANIFYRPLQTPTRPLQVVRVNADASDNFDSVWRKVFRRIKRELEGTEWWADQAHEAPIAPDDVTLELGNFRVNETPIVIIDEFDRIQDASCRRLMTDTIKSLSDHAVNCTLIIVGVAEAITDLMQEHASISRALVQVPMRRMSAAELQDIVATRVKRLRLQIHPDALWRIGFFAAGLPYYAHLLGKHSVLRAVEATSRMVTEQHVREGMLACLEDVDYSIRDVYAKATRRAYRNENIYAQVLAAAALTEHDVIGRFGASDVSAPLSAIMGTEFRTPSFSFHLKEMSEPARGPVFAKWEYKKTFRFSFVEPLMQPYIIMTSLSKGILTEDVVRRFTIERQSKLSI